MTEQLIINWDAISAIATAFMALVILAAAIIAVRQIYEMRAARQLGAYTNLVQFLQREDIRKARRTLLKDLTKKNNFNFWTEKEVMEAEKVCHTYSSAGTMEDERFVPKDFIAKEWHKSIVRCWEAAEPMITKYRDDRGKDFWASFERLYKRAKKYDEAVKQGDTVVEDG